MGQAPIRSLPIFKKAPQQSSSEPVYEASAEGRRFPEFLTSLSSWRRLRTIFIPWSSILSPSPTMLLVLLNWPPLISPLTYFSVASASIETNF
jgi:hypothetical protein